MILSSVTYTFLLLHLSISVLLLLFLVFVHELLAQVVKLNTLPHGLCLHLQHTDTHVT